MSCIFPIQNRISFVCVSVCGGPARVSGVARGHLLSVISFVILEFTGS